MKKVILLLSVLALVGCAGARNIPVDRATLPMLKGKSLTVVTHESPSFVAMTSGKGMFAVAGVGAAASAGNQLVKDDQIVDPATKIGQMLAQNLNSGHGLILNGQTGKQADTKDMADIIKQADGSDYALDIFTNGWSFIYDGFKFSEYIVGYSVKMRLIDVASSKAIAEGFCAYDTKSAGKPNVGYETLLENDSAYIKQSLSDATTTCVEKFSTELF